MNKTSPSRKMVLAALFAALTFIATLIHIHIPGMVTGYVNTGDCMVIVSALLLGPLYGSFAAATGSALTDLLHGYAMYVPGTFIIKLLMGVTIYYVYALISKQKQEYKSVPTVIGGAFGEIIMTLGYFLYEGLFIVGFSGAAVGIYGNMVQGVLCIVLSVLLLKFLKKTNLTKMI